MYVADQTWPELGDYVAEESLAVVPLGSTEQHGPHLPLSTDHVIAESLAREAADRTGFLCTPTVNVGVSPHHKQFHGTMWVDAPQFRDYVESLTRNLTYHGIDRVLYVNAHGGNVQHLREVGRRLRDAGDCYAVEWMWNDAIPELVEELFETPGPHGGPKETAMMLHLDPRHVRSERLVDAAENGLREWDDPETIRYGSRTFYDAIDNTDNGVLGDQTDATAEKGERLFEAAADRLVRLLRWLDEQPFEGLMPKDRVEPRPGNRRRPRE
jgi:creatinine amidohydrolase